MMADWLQGPLFVYALYASYGFSREGTTPSLFCGRLRQQRALRHFLWDPWRDKYGRRNFAAPVLHPLSRAGELKKITHIYIYYIYTLFFFFFPLNVFVIAYIYIYY